MHNFGLLNAPWGGSIEDYESFSNHFGATANTQAFWNFPGSTIDSFGKLNNFVLFTNSGSAKNHGTGLINNHNVNFGTYFSLDVDCSLDNGGVYQL